MERTPSGFVGKQPCLQIAYHLVSRGKRIAGEFEIRAAVASDMLIMRIRQCRIAVKSTNPGWFSQEMRRIICRANKQMQNMAPLTVKPALCKSMRFGAYRAWLAPRVLNLQQMLRRSVHDPSSIQAVSPRFGSNSIGMLSA
jgi:hypothetical protein